MSAIMEVSPADKKAVVKTLSLLLADSYTLYLKTQNFHWNVKGAMFQPLHQMFEDQYKDLAEAVDLIAERIRVFDEYTPATFADFARQTSIKEPTGPTKAPDMIRQLLKDHETLAQTVAKTFAAAEKADDQATMDLLNDRQRVHEKTAWMLRSFLES